MPRQRPRIFVGSSREGLRIAKGVQVVLDQSCEVEVWSEGVFGMGQTPMEALTSALKRFDFAIFVLTADDLRIVRGESKLSARDNVIFELGFFTGGLGRERTFMVYDRTRPPEIPSDLDAITAATFEPHSSRNLEAALGAPCTKIQIEIEKHGLRVKYGFYGVGTVPMIVERLGLTERTGTINFTQLSEENSAGQITISYGVPITIPWEFIEVVGSGGLSRARIDQSRSSHASGLLSVEVPAGGRYGDSIRVSGVRVAVYGTAITYLSASIAMEGNTIPPNQSLALVASSLASSVASIKATPCVLNTASSLATAHGQLRIREGVFGSFVARNQMTPGMTNGMEFLLSVSGLVSGLDFLIEDNLPIIKVGTVKRDRETATIQLILLEYADEITVSYRVVTSSLLVIKSPLQVTGTISLGPVGPGLSKEGRVLPTVPRYAPVAVGSLVLAELR